METLLDIVNHHARLKQFEEGERALAQLVALKPAAPQTLAHVVEREDGLKVFLTIHPSLILRIRELAKACGEAWLKTEGGGTR